MSGRCRRSFAGNRVVAHTGSAYPILQAPMTWVARAALVSAVSEAGAMGIMENTSRDLAVTRREFTHIRRATSNLFGVNLPVRFLKQDEAEEGRIIDWLLENGVTFVTTSAGDPTRYIRRLKEAGVIVYHAVPTLYGALKAEDAGVDGLVVEGAESAGVRNEEETHTMVLLRAVSRRVTVPIVAAGGIADGRGMAAAFALGAEGVAMGTRFVASVESPVHQNYKDAIVAAPLGGTAVSPFPPRARIRTLRTSNLPDADFNVIEPLYVRGDTVNAPGSAGESSGLIDKVEPVRDIVLKMVDGFWTELERLSALCHGPDADADDTPRT